MVDSIVPWPRLRPYQLEVARAILAAVRARDGRTISVQIARQGGKNELSARVEMLLLLTAGAADCIKVAPSLRPQGQISLNRLWTRLQEGGLVPPAVRQGNAIELRSNRLLLLSAARTANVLGHTAGALMEVDEAQDVDPERFSRDFRPMGASRATPVVFYGTPWSETSLLAEMKQRHLEQEHRDGLRRHFEFDWEAVAAANPSYAQFAEQERERLGAQHPAWRTQYCLETMPGAGRLFTRPQLALMQGRHPRVRRRGRGLDGCVIVAGLDVGGEALSPGREPDETVLTLLAVVPSSRASPEWQGMRTSEGLPILQILDHLAWRGRGHDALLNELTLLLAEQWRPQSVAIDVSGIGEGLAAGLVTRLGGSARRAQIVRLRFTEQIKSRLGFGLLAAAERLRCYAGDGSPEYRRFWQQMTKARATYKPNRLMSFSVDPADGNDDYLVSLALAVEAAAAAQPRVARGRRALVGDDP